MICNALDEFGGFCRVACALHETGDRNVLGDSLHLVTEALWARASASGPSSVGIERVARAVFDGFVTSR
jgi:hypothetical protein